MGCFSGRLMTSASDQKLFCEVCSALNYSFDEFVGEKGVSPSYSSAILAPLLSILNVTEWRSKWQPTPVFLPGKIHGQRSLAG